MSNDGREAAKEFCAEEGCNAFVLAHRWGKIKAEGWFFSRSENKGYCPEHVPEWVESWRAKKAQARPKNDTVILLAECSSCQQPITRKPGEEDSWVHESGDVKCGVVGE